MTTTRPLQLSTGVMNFAVDDPGDWTYLLERVQAADRAGIDRIVVSDHVVFGEQLDEYGRPEVGGSKGGKQPTGPDGHWLEPLTLLSVIAGQTQRIRLGTSILIAALRRPVVLAKTLTTLDVLSQGRVDLGVGVGWQKAEYDAAGLAFAGRGALLDHTLSVLHTVWSEQRASFSDDRLSFDAIHMMPKSRQPGGIPIWVSGTTNPMVARRLARFGTGWIPWGPAIADPVAGMAEMRRLVEAAGGSFDGIEVVGALAPVKGSDGTVDLAASMARVPELVAAGITDFRLTVPMPTDASAAFDIYSEMVATFRGL